MNLLKTRVLAIFAVPALWVVAVSAQGPASPQPDGLDTAWNAGGTLALPLPDFEISSATMQAQPDGRILLAGQCNHGAVTTTCMARLLPDGAKDTSFGPRATGVFAFPELGAGLSDFLVGPRGLLLQKDGRIVIAGSRIGTAAAVRLLANGTLDPSVAVQPVTFEFSHYDPVPYSFIQALAQQVDGKIVVAGRTYASGTASVNIDFAAARLRTDLTLDPSFNGTGKNVFAFDLGGYDEDSARAITIQPDGKIVITGFAETSTNGRDLAVARLAPDGTLDSTFGTQGRAAFDLGRHLDDEAGAVKIDAAGHIWVAGYRQYGGWDLDFVAARLLDDGSGFDPDFCSTHFDLPDSLRSDVAEDLLLQSDGKIVLVGSASNSVDGYSFAVARLSPNCFLDTSFGSGGQLTGRFPGSAIVNMAFAAGFGGKGIVIAGIAADSSLFNGRSNGQFGVAQIKLDLIFTDAFER